MLQSTKYMYLIKSKMMSLDSTRAFKPFLTSLIIKENIDKTFDQDLSKSFEKEYGFNLPFFILTNIIVNYISDGYASNNHSFLYFDINKMKSLPQVDTTDFSFFSIEYEGFIDKFMHYCKSDDLKRNKAEDVIMSFIKTYDIDLIANVLEINDFEEMEVERFLFYMFIKDIYKNDLTTYNFLIKLCQGNLIKSYLFNEGISSKIKEESLIFLDSPILYRILGYDGEYYQNEYEYLIKLWLSQGYKLYVFDHNLDEMMFLLRKCMEIMEDVHFNYSKAPQITQTFKEMGWDSIDVEKEIAVFEEKLQMLGINKYVVDYNQLNEKFLEDQQEITTKIKQIYSIRQPNIIDESLNFGKTKMIETDAKSVFCAYAIRENNKVKNFSESRLFYVTNNSGLSQAIYEYNKEKYQNTISPIIRDTLIGMMACSNDMEKIHEIVERKMISLCFSTYRPTKKTLELFTSQIESMKLENQITDEQYLMLKHDKTVMPLLMELIDGKYSNIDYKTINELIARVEETYTAPIRDEYEQKIQILKGEKEKYVKIEEKLMKEVGEKQELLQEEIKKSNEKNEETERLKTQIINQRDKKIISTTTRIAIFVNFTILLVTLIFIALNITVYIMEGYSCLTIATSVLSLILTVYSIVIFMVKNQWKSNVFVKRIINKKINRINAEYDSIVR